MKELIAALPGAAKSPYALTAYAICAIAFLVAGAQLRQVRTLSEQVRHLPLKERRRGLEVAAGTVLPTTISADDWLRLQRIRWAGLLLGALIAAIMTVVVIAITTKPERSSKVAIEHAATKTTKDLSDTIDKSAKVVTKVVTDTIGASATRQTTKLDAVDKHLSGQIEESKTAIIRTNKTNSDRAAIATLEVLFPSIARTVTDVDGTIIKLKGSNEEVLSSFDYNFRPMRLRWGDRFHYIPFIEDSDVTLPDSARVILVVMPNGYPTLRIPLPLKAFTDNEVTIPGHSPRSMDAIIENPMLLKGVSIKVTIYSTDRERGRARFRESLFHTSLASEARKMYLQVTSTGTYLYAKPGSARLRELDINTIVKLTDANGKWGRVRLPEGRSGWVPVASLGPIK